MAEPENTGESSVTWEIQVQTSDFHHLWLDRKIKMVFIAPTGKKYWTARFPPKLGILGTFFLLTHSTTQLQIKRGEVCLAHVFSPQ